MASSLQFGNNLTRFLRQQVEQEVDVEEEEEDFEDEDDDDEVGSGFKLNPIERVGQKFPLKSDQLGLSSIKRF